MQSFCVPVEKKTTEYLSTITYHGGEEPLWYVAPVGRNINKRFYGNVSRDGTDPTPRIVLGPIPTKNGGSDMGGETRINFI